MDKQETPQGLGQDYWIREFHKIPFPGMELLEVTFFRHLEEDFFEKHNKFLSLTKDFLKMLGTEKAEELSAFGFDEDKIKMIANVHLPENFVVHLKYPFEYGGACSFDNMVLMLNRPYHTAIHKYVDRQTITDTGIVKPYKLYVPTPTGQIYWPEGEAGVGGGKSNANLAQFKTSNSR